jgi:hypothetical protein
MTARHVGQHDGVAHRHSLDTAADLLDDTRGFVPEHDGQRNVVELVACHHVGVAHAGRHDPNQHFIGTRLFQGKRFDLKRPAFLADHRPLDLSR